MKRITIEDVLKKSGKLRKRDVAFIRKAFKFARKQHKGQKRKTGENFLIHPLYTAYYIADLGLGKDSIAAAFLHDVIEDCNVSESELKREFNPTVVKLVRGVTKLRRTEKTKITKSSVDNLRRFLIVAATDIRVLIIKLADRFHNAQTIEGLSEERQKTYAQEIKYIFSALSDYLGIYYFKRQFDDIAFRILNPIEYKRINNYLQKNHKKRRSYVNKITKKIKKILAQQKIRNEVYGREKSIYSIHKKLGKYLREGKIHSQSEYGRVYDNFGFRILVPTKEDCYKVLGIIHSTWPPLSGEFDDYIANPKPNGYRSLQTTVFCDNNKLAEIQIRTYKMHEYNEFGPASHIAYQLSGRRNPLPTAAFNWLRKINIFRRGTPKRKSEKSYKIKVLKDNIFVLTPKKEVKQLPKGSTPIDFAYSVHTVIGNKCRGAKVNKKLVSLDYELHTGDQVEIIIERKAKYPKPKWLEFAVSPGARSKIKNALRKKEEKEAIEKGHKKLNTQLKKFNTNFKRLYKQRKNDIDIFIYKNNTQNIDGFLSRIGFDLLKVEKFINHLFPKEERPKRKKKRIGKISIEGSTDTKYTLAKCCKPKLKDPIIALTTVNRGMRIHKSDCVFRDKFYKDRILKAEWV